MLYKSETGISYTIYIYYLSVERKRNVIQLGDRIKAYKYEIHILYLPRYLNKKGNMTAPKDP